MIGVSLHFPFQLRQSGFHLIVSAGVVRGVRRKWKRSDFSDSDTVVLMTPLTTLIFYFHQVISGLMKPLKILTSTPLLVKTSP